MCPCKVSRPPGNSPCKISRPPGNCPCKISRPCGNPAVACSMPAGDSIKPRATHHGLKVKITFQFYIQRQEKHATMFSELITNYNVETRSQHGGWNRPPFLSLKKNKITSFYQNWFTTISNVVGGNKHTSRRWEKASVLIF